MIGSSLVMKRERVGSLFCDPHRKTVGYFERPRAFPLTSVIGVPVLPYFSSSVELHFRSRRAFAISYSK